MPAQTMTTAEDAAPGMSGPLACIFSADIYADVCSAPTRPTFHYGGSYLLNAVQAIQKQDVTAEGPRDELQQYLKSGVESTTDVVGWWGVSPIYLRCEHRIHV
jgi:hypothetical protein